MIPALFGVSVSQINLLLDTFWRPFRARLGQLAVLLDRLNNLPLGCLLLPLVW